MPYYINVHTIERSKKTMEFDLCESLFRYLGKTVTIFTKSGGLSGSGFTGVLVAVDKNCVSLITRIGAPPACALGSACTGPMGDYGASYYGGNWFGAITEIPICSIASFTHNAI